MKLRSCAFGKRLGRKKRSLKPELLHGVLAGGHLCGEDSENRDHGHAPVVELLHPHLVVVHVHAEGVPVVARLLAGWRIKKNIRIKN